MVPTFYFALLFYKTENLTFYIKQLNRADDNIYFTLGNRSQIDMQLLFGMEYKIKLCPVSRIRLFLLQQSPSARHSHGF